MADATVTNDSLRGLESGLGGERDKAARHSFYTQALDRSEIDAMYDGDWIAAKAIDAPCFDSVRAWRAWQAEDAEIEAIEEEERRLGIREKVLEASVLGRLYGGGALIMGIGTQAPETPLVLDSVGKGALQYVHVLDRAEITPTEMRRDPRDPWYGEPVLWEFSTETGVSLRVHPSRVVTFTGRRRSGVLRRTDPWGVSALQAMYTAIRNAAIADAAIASLLTEAKIDIIKVPSLMMKLATQEYTDLLTQRFKTAMSIKSLVNALVLDKEEEYEQKQISFAQLPETLQQYMVLVSGAADVPVVRFLGQSPGGLNSTGESDLRNYYDRISADQVLTLTPRLSRLDEVLIRSATGRRDKAVHYAWNPLWQTSEKEASEIEKNRAETFSKNASSGLVPSKVLSKVLVNTLTETGRYPGIETAMQEYEDEAGEFDPDADDTDEIDPDTGEPVRAGAAVGDAAPRTLYVHRKVLNGAAILKWARAQGFAKPQKASELHVTIAYSRTPLDWMKVGQAWQAKVELPEGGPRLMDQFGEAKVLLFRASELEWRHEDIKRAGAVWAHGEYQPHITISWEDEGIDLSKVEPYQGKIVLGPEIFAEIDEDWEEKAKE